MNWPNHFLIFVLVSAMVSIVLPWLVPACLRRYFVVPLVVPCAVTILWFLYEQHLKDIARPGDPLIRIDLFLIIPLIAMDWISSAAAIAIAQLRSNTPPLIKRIYGQN